MELRTYWLREDTKLLDYEMNMNLFVYVRTKSCSVWFVGAAQVSHSRVPKYSNFLEEAMSSILPMALVHCCCSPEAL